MLNALHYTYLEKGSTRPAALCDTAITIVYKISIAANHDDSRSRM